ncbi:hypothetical protein [Rubellimicrobium aerolatum]|uniref:DUF5681 domain-containing protein n=1 Tax=Rubellimicrobium aerolatum TaxID=490979 RepID=A0ABW0SCK1_9RHOB|nr:hypothetical protein [Rubellimicrobium aerolatum]MBP1806146.1 hypothetical protein [Rubellimicrobium aerolatum]
MADYSKQKSGKPQKNRPPHREHNEPGGPANPFGRKAEKAALLERMKANLGKKDEGAEGQG